MIDKLPTEALLMIFGHCDLESVSRITRVNSQLKSLAEDSVLWKKRVLSGKDTGIHLPAQSLIDLCERSFNNNYKELTRHLLELSKDKECKHALDILSDISHTKKISKDSYSEVLQQVIKHKSIGLLLILNPIYQLIITQPENIGYQIGFMKILREHYSNDNLFIRIVLEKIPSLFNYITDYWLNKISSDEKFKNMVEQYNPGSLLNVYIRENQVENVKKLLPHVCMNDLNRALKEATRCCNLSLFNELLKARANPASKEADTFYTIIEYIINHGKKGLENAKPLLEIISKEIPSILEIQIDRKEFALSEIYKGIVDDINDLLEEIKQNSLSSKDKFKK